MSASPSASVAPVFPFENSIRVVAAAALRESGAVGFGLFTASPDAPGWARLFSLGEEVSVTDASNDKVDVLVFPLSTNGQVDGLAAFRVASNPGVQASAQTLGRMARAIEALWAERHLEYGYLRLLRRVSSLQAELIDSKIAERASGLLKEGADPDAVESVVRHVRTVFSSTVTAQPMQVVLRELEQEVEERRLTREAKAILQESHAISEQQAYTHLRLLSRKTRRRLSDVSRDVVRQHGPATRTA